MFVDKCRLDELISVVLQVCDNPEEGSHTVFLPQDGDLIVWWRDPDVVSIWMRGRDVVDVTAENAAAIVLRELVESGYTF